jgi:hypothetical protein
MPYQGNKENEFYRFYQGRNREFTRQRTRAFADHHRLNGRIRNILGDISDAVRSRRVNGTPIRWDPDFNGRTSFEW